MRFVLSFRVLNTLLLVYVIVICFLFFWCTKYFAIFFPSVSVCVCVCVFVTYLERLLERIPGHRLSLPFKSERIYIASERNRDSSLHRRDDGPNSRNASMGFQEQNGASYFLAREGENPNSALRSDATHGFRLCMRNSRRRAIEECHFYRNIRLRYHVVNNYLYKYILKNNKDKSIVRKGEEDSAREKKNARETLQHISRNERDVERGQRKRRRRRMWGRNNGRR